MTPEQTVEDLWRRKIAVRGTGGRARVVRIVTRLPERWTANCGSGPSTLGRGGRSCGSERATGGR